MAGGSGPARGRHAPWWFLALTLTWTWTLWGVAAVTATDWRVPHALALFVLGGLGPLLVASLLVATGRAHETPGEFWRRALDPRRLALRWWAALTALAVLPPLLLRLATTGTTDEVAVAAPAAFLLVGALAGAAEEPGWRGYAQEGLQRRFSVVTSSLVVGVCWGAWHLPLFWLPGTYQHGLGIGTRAFWTFHLAILVATVLYGWLYNTAGRVTLAAVWFHAAANVAGELFPAPGAEAETLILQVLIVAAVLVGARRWMLREAECSGATVRSSSQTP